MWFMVNETWPSKSSAEVGEKAVEYLSKPLPSYMKRIGPLVTAGGDGVKAYMIFEVEKGHEEEGVKEIIDGEAPFLSIEGYKFTVEPVLTAEEALPLVGLAPP